MNFQTPLPHINGYQVIKEVGSGSFGKAYLVKKAAEAEQRHYCLKVITTSKMSEREKKDALQEARLLANLKHPYIVQFRESWCEEGRFCIVMDYAENGDLHQRIAKQRRSGKMFPEQQIIRWFTQAVLAIKHMHERKILHRDIKSSNFFLTADGRVRVGDFGIAKELASTNAMARTTIGTPYYLAPEICRHQPYSWSADIWSLGIVLFELCALRVPYDAPNIRALSDKIVNTTPPSIPSCYSQELLRLVHSLLAKDPGNRPSATAVLAHPLLQAEIRNMLKEEQAKKEEQRKRAEGQQQPGIISKPPSEGIVSTSSSRRSQSDSRPPSPRSSNNNMGGPAVGVVGSGGVRQPSPSGNGNIRAPSPGVIAGAAGVAAGRRSSYSNNIPYSRQPSPVNNMPFNRQPSPVQQPSYPGIRAPSPSGRSNNPVVSNGRISSSSNSGVRLPSPSGLYNGGSGVRAPSPSGGLVYRPSVAYAGAAGVYARGL